VAGGLDPLAVDGGFFIGGDGPVGLKAAEVVEAHHVIEGEGAADARDPPVEAALAELAPAVERVAPALAGGGEIIGRDAGDAEHVAVFVKLEEFGMGPDVGGVVVDEDGDVAEDADVALAAVGAKGAPLLVEEELDDLLDGEFAGVVVERSGESVMLALGVLDGPLMPTGVVEAAAEDIEHGVVGEP